MKFLLIVLLTTFTCTVLAQNIETEIKAENVFELSIIDIYPENYPEVSVIFQAKNKNGKPLWLLTKSEMTISENGDRCEVLRLVNITTRKPLNIALVFDHSGSMVDDPNQRPEGVSTMQEIYFNGGTLPEGYIMPIEHAKNGVYRFISDNHNEEDSVLFIGFSSEVDKPSPLTNDLSTIKPYIDKTEPSGRTAFYDALYQSIEQLKSRTSKPVIVSITDGGDNSSIHTHEEIIELAQKHEIPIYIIGLGDVEKFYLKELASATDGFFYYTNSPDQLETIYRNIKEQLRSIYQVDYHSLSEDFISEDRILKFSFLNDTLTFSNPSSKFSLPDEAIAYIEKKEAERLEEIEFEKQEALNRKILLGGIGGGILLLGIGSFILIRRRKVKVKIEQLSPNPFQEKVTIHYIVSDKITNPELTITTIRGTHIGTFPISNTDKQITIDTTSWKRGVLLFTISGSGKTSEVFKGVKR